MGSPETRGEQESQFENAMAMVEKRPDAYIDPSIITAEVIDTTGQNERFDAMLTATNRGQSGSFDGWKREVEGAVTFGGQIGISVWYMACQIAKRLYGLDPILTDGDKVIGMVSKAAKLLKLGDDLLKKTVEEARTQRKVFTFWIGCGIESRQMNEARIVCLAHALGFDQECEEFFHNNDFADAVRQDLGIIKVEKSQESPVVVVEPISEVGPKVEATTETVAQKLERMLQGLHVEAESFGNPSYYALLVEQVADGVEERYPGFVNGLKEEFTNGDYRAELEKRVANKIDNEIRRKVENELLNEHSVCSSVFNSIAEKIFGEMGMNMSFNFAEVRLAYEMLESIKTIKEDVDAEEVLMAFLYQVTKSPNKLKGSERAIYTLKAEFRMNDWIVRKLGSDYRNRAFYVSRNACKKELGRSGLTVPAEFQKYIEMRDELDVEKKGMDAEMSRLSVNLQSHFWKLVKSWFKREVDISNVSSEIVFLGVSISNIMLGILGESKYGKQLIIDVKRFYNEVSKMNNNVGISISGDKMLKKVLGEAGFAVLQEEIRKRKPRKSDKDL